MLLTVCLALPSPARAQLQAPAALDTFLSQVRENCGDTPEADHFIEALRVELSTAPFTASDLTATKAHSCDPERGVVHIALSERQLTLDVSDVPPQARPRTLAVAFAETLRLPSLPSPAPVSPPPPSTQPPSTQQPSTYKTPTPLSPARKHEKPPNLVDAPERKPRFQVPVSLRALIVGPEQTIAVGANLGLSLTPTPGLSMGAHVGYLTAHHRSALGEARLHGGALEGAVDLTLLRPSAHSTVDLGVHAAVYRAWVLVQSAWGFDEPVVGAWFALWGLHASLSTVLNNHVRVFTRIGGVKDLRGVSLIAGGGKAMSFYGFGAEVRLGAGYAW